MAPLPQCPQKPVAAADQGTATDEGTLGNSPTLAYISVGEEEVLLRAGSLLKRRGLPSAITPPRDIGSASAGSYLQHIFWRRRYVELTSHRILYWMSLENRGAGNGDSPRGEFALSDLDDVSHCRRQVFLHFEHVQHGGRRDALVFSAASDEEAGQWAEACRQAAAARLCNLVPSSWKLFSMLNGNGVAKRVVKVELSDDNVQVVQHVLDHTLICKRTRDRRGEEIPVRLVAEKVLSVQNVTAWMRYCQARADVRIATVSTPCDERVVLDPEVLTATCLSSLGWVDKPANEHWLFHGTSLASAQDITDGEFRMDLAGSHRGTLYGKAVYLAECSSKADEYAEADDGGLCAMLLCRATLGKIFIERDKRPSAPELEEHCRGKFHSVCGDRWAAVGTFREFAVYDNRQVYPEYIVYYRRMYQAALLQGISAIGNGDTTAGAGFLIPYAAQLALTHPDPQIKYRISLLLGAHAATVIPALIECLGDDVALRRRVAAAALAHVADFWSRSNTDHISNVSYSSSFGGIDGHDPESPNSPQTRAHLVALAVPALIRCLSDDCATVRKASAQALEQIGSLASDAAPSLVDSLADPSLDVRCAAARALSKMGVLIGSRGVAALAAACGQDSPWELRKAAVEALGCMGALADQASQAFSDCLRSDESPVRCAAARAVQRLGSFGTFSVESLLVCCDADDASVRLAACRALGSVAVFLTSVSIEKVLTERVLGDAHDGVRSAATVALGRLVSSSSVSTLCSALKDTNGEVRLAAAHALSFVKLIPTSAVPSLLRALKDAHADIRLAAAEALGHSSDGSMTTTRALALCLADQNIAVRKAAAVSLGEVGLPSDGAFAALVERLRDPNDDVRKAARVALEMLHQKREPSDADGGDEGSAAADESQELLSFAD